MVTMLLGHADGRGRNADLGQAGAVDALPGDEGRAAGGAGLLAVAVGEQHAFLGDAVDVGRLVAHQAVRVATEVRHADVVAPDDEDVGLPVPCVLAIRCSFCYVGGCCSMIDARCCPLRHGLARPSRGRWAGRAGASSTEWPTWKTMLTIAAMPMTSSTTAVISVSETGTGFRRGRARRRSWPRARSRRPSMNCTW